MNIEGSNEDLGAYFNHRYEVLIANTPELLDEVAQLRYRVYVKEFGYDLQSVEGRESDPADEFSVSVLLRNRETGEAVGCSRLVKPKPTVGGLPFEAYALRHVDRKLFDWKQIESQRCCEISRVAIAAPYRHRYMPGLDPSVRSIPFLALALYYAMGRFVLDGGFDFIFTVSEVRLARQKSVYGLEFTQISEVFDHFGLRAVFFTTGQRFAREIVQWRPALRGLYQVVSKQLFAQTLQYAEIKQKFLHY